MLNERVCFCTTAPVTSNCPFGAEQMAFQAAHILPLHVIQQSHPDGSLAPRITPTEMTFPSISILAAIDGEYRNPLTRDVCFLDFVDAHKHVQCICRRSCSFTVRLALLRVLTIVTSGGKVSRSDFQPFSPLLSRMSCLIVFDAIYSATRISSMTSRAAFCSFARFGNL